MIRIFHISLISSCLLIGGTAAERVWIDDREIRDRFIEQTAALNGSPGRRGLSAADLRRELRKEKRGVSGLNLAGPEAWEGSPAELYQKTKRSTLIVGHLFLCDSCDKWHSNLAGGVLITADGVVVTNYHVLEFEKAAVFAAMDDRGNLFAIEEVLASDRESDLAIIRLEISETLHPAPLASGAEIGDAVVVVSHPDAHFFSFTSGAISRFSTDPENAAHRLEISAPFARGSSGSGIFNSDGHLVGIASATNAIYYEEDDREPRNLQMVIHSGVPVASLKNLIEGR